MKYAVEMGSGAMIHVYLSIYLSIYLSVSVCLSVYSPLLGLGRYFSFLTFLNSQ
jgi:hypothetical protein